LSEREPKHRRVGISIDTIAIEVPIFTEEELLAADKAFDDLIGAGIEARSWVRRLRRKVHDAREKFGADADPTPPPLLSVVPDDPKSGRRR
jgi:hypothetical protein